MTDSRTSMTASLLAPVLALAALVLLPACAAPPSSAAAAEKEALRRNAVLGGQLMGLADLGAALTKEQATRAVAEHRTELQTTTMARLHAGIASAMRSMAVNASPHEGLVTMYIWVKLGEHACRNRVRLVPEYVVDDCDELFGKLNGVVDQIASRHLDAKQIAQLDELIAAYKRQHPDALVFGLLRIDDIAGTDSATELVLSESAPSMMSSVTDASRQIEVARLLGVQAVWMLARLPESIGSYLESTVSLAIEEARVHEISAHARDISDNVRSASAAISEVAAAQRQLSQDVATLASAIHGATERAERAGSIALGVGVMGLGALIGYAWRSRAATKR